MALKCGVNSRTYEPTGDGFDRDVNVALMVATGDFLKSLARVTDKLATYSAQNCPRTCPPKVVTTPDTRKDPVFDVTWQAAQKRWHVRIGVKITRTVTCGKAAPKPKPKPKGTGPMPPRKSQAR